MGTQQCPQALRTLQGFRHPKLVPRMLSPVERPADLCAWTRSPALLRGTVLPSHPFGCRLLLHVPATPGAADATSPCSTAGSGREEAVRLPSLLPSLVEAAEKGPCLSLEQGKHPSLQPSPGVGPRQRLGSY